jgi:hypothetical protein
MSVLKKPAPTPEYVAKLRRCLKCRGKFESTWAGERICGTCKKQDCYSSASLRERVLCSR